MASEDYLPLFRRARADHLRNIQNVSAEIVALYRQAIADLVKKALEARRGSLTQRWAAEYVLSLEQRVKELEAQLYDVTLQGLKRSAALPTIAMGDWWEAVGGQSFRDAFALPPDNVLTGLLDGSFYRDRKGLSERIWQVAQDFEKDVGYIVQRGIAEKKSVVELAADLEQYVEKPAKRDWDWGKVYPNLSGKKVDYNAQRLARTSINHAYFLDNVKVCTENPFVTAMHWDLSNAHYERQVIPFGPDECDEYAEHDEGLGLGNFKPEEIPVPHPQCLCAQWAVIPDSLEDIGARIGAWASGEPDAVLDEWYDKYGNRNPNGDPREILRGNGGELLQNAAGSGRIKMERVAVNHSVTDQSIQAVPLVNVFDDEDKNIQFREICQDLLKIVKASGTEPGTEFSFVYNLALERIGGYVQGDIGRVSIENPNVFHHAFHNHGTGETLGFSDIYNLTNRQRQMSITAVGNTGSVYCLMKDKTVKRNEYLTYLLNASQEVIYSANGTDFTLASLDQIKSGKSGRDAIDGLDEQQTDALHAAMLSSIEKIMKDGEKFGFKYISGTPRLANGLAD